MSIPEPITITEIMGTVLAYGQGHGVAEFVAPSYHEERD